MEDSIFTKIVRGDIPCHKIYETDTVLAFLDINPRAEGHTLVIPKVNPAEFVWDLGDEIYDDMMHVCKKIALHMRQASGKQHVHQGVVGTDVPYAHIHLVPFDSVSDLHVYPKYEDTELRQIAEKLRFS